jgi:hypothetical protein
VLNPNCGLGVLNVDTVARKMWNWIPRNRTRAADAQLTTYAGGCNGHDYRDITTKNYVAAAAQTQHTKTWSVRIDHHFTDKDQIFGRFADNPVCTYYPGYFPQITSAAISADIYPSGASDFVGIYSGGNNNNFPGPSNTVSRNLQLDYAHIFNRNLIADLKEGYSRISIVTLLKQPDFLSSHEST